MYCRQIGAGANSAASRTVSVNFCGSGQLCLATAKDRRPLKAEPRSAVRSRGSASGRSESDHIAHMGHRKPLRRHRGPLLGKKGGPIGARRALLTPGDIIAKGWAAGIHTVPFIAARIRRAGLLRDLPIGFTAPEGTNGTASPVRGACAAHVWSIQDRSKSPETNRAPPAPNQAPTRTGTALPGRGCIFRRKTIFSSQFLPFAEPRLNFPASVHGFCANSAI